MKYIIVLISSFLLMACTTPIVDMADNTQIQLQDLSDADNDGVITSREKCPASFAGSKVDNYGCGADIINKVRQELKVNFASNSAVVSKRYFGDIEALANFMKKHLDTEVVIEGHTSKLGSKSLNMRLSQERAQAVMNILVNNFGIATSRVSAVGYGFERILDDGNTKSAHAKNRRIVAELTSESTTKDMKWNIYSVDK
ncbi:OmpA family protein [Moritella viscosa]|uniref:OmpA family protein n=1 Tax=Moritella viscosa TaxID=80854 RepID=A0A1L0A2D9_9GAMM|nr:OmpA family protein [Moritella viscosa]SGY95036.1 OmpA family protein [Moritella viscosa]SGZ06697.1 OmpA family protein [Moritella viscosa]SGZ06903.1 OmpA family protein [Moritella viscosa]SHO09496.1 OmpA family protein [Moritella viscosa]SHO09534.1 OmpA family protein [Moritella viscosa]